jgi:hypothetical protein
VQLPPIFILIKTLKRIDRKGINSGKRGRKERGKKMVINSKGMEEITDAIRYLEIIVEITEKHLEQFNWENMKKIVDEIKKP